MIKSFHKLTQIEYEQLIDCHLSYVEMDKLYPQPDWCTYPRATWGMYGCWRLVSLLVRSIEDCMDCEFCNGCARGIE